MENKEFEIFSRPKFQSEAKIWSLSDKINLIYKVLATLFIVDNSTMDLLN